MYSQTQAECRPCNGRGKIIEKKNMCESCKGNQVKRIIDEIEVPIEKGIPDNSKMAIRGKGHEMPDCINGDLIIYLKISPHKNFVQEGSDLLITQKISLIESLRGFKFNLKHISDQEITI